MQKKNEIGSALRRFFAPSRPYGKLMLLSAFPLCLGASVVAVF
jgi:hypothetical protein